MDLNEKVKIQVTSVDSEELFFRQQEQEKIARLRTKSCQESTDQYCEEHKNHCFRCGTRSLVEVDRGNFKIDVCVNAGCGAVHLDPGELEALTQEDMGAIKRLQRAISDVFK
ncbi:MAG: zf-TFIIB domain-containing protein [Thermodesulfobacteriota bacterium]